MLVYLLDTNLCVRMLRYRPPHLQARFAELSSQLAISTIVLKELLHGAAKSSDARAGRIAVGDLAARLVVLPFDSEAADHAADIHADLERRGQVIGSNDVLIAGHARSRALIVVTGNLGEFSRVEGLRCEDWLATG